jgi:hypothetical protein
METGFGVVTTGAVSMLLMEGIKWLIKVIGKKPDFGFPPALYYIGIPVLNALVPFALVWLGMEVTAPTLGMTGLEIVKYIVLTVVSSVISLVGYTDGIAPLKAKTKLMKGLEG